MLESSFGVPPGLRETEKLPEMGIFNQKKNKQKHDVLALQKYGNDIFGVYVCYYLLQFFLTGDGSKPIFERNEPPFTSHCGVHSGTV